MSSLVYGAGALKGLRGYIDGLIMSNDADTDHDINISVGLAQDAANANLIELLSEITKQIDAAWALGDDAGGMLTGAVANSTWYHVFLIRRSDTGVVDAGFYTGIDPTAVLPAGYDQYRRIGSVLTDLSANIINFKQIGDHFFWNDPPEDVDAASITTSQTLKTLSVPPDVNVIANFRWQINNVSSGAYALVKFPDTNDETPALGSAPLTDILGSTVGISYSTRSKILSNTSSQVAFTAGAASTTLDVATVGWEDFRGKQ